MTWRILPAVVWVLILCEVVGTAVCQNPKSGDSIPAPRSELRGKGTFDLNCALCHGLDGLGGEHAPDIVRQPAAKSLSDEALFHVIHDGIPQRGMPAFSGMTKEDTDAVIVYLRFLQGKSAVSSMRGDPARGRDLFFGKAGCSGCHQLGSEGQFVAGELTGFARDHEWAEIRDAILKPSGELPETASAIAQDGRKFTGTIRNEDNSSLQLQDGDGRFYLLMKSGLVSVQRQAEAPMPSDYGQRLTTTELDDLVSYIWHETHTSESRSRKEVAPHAQD